MREDFGFDFFTFRYGKAKITIEAENFKVVKIVGDDSEWNQLDYDEQYEQIVEQFDIKFESMFE
jgi:hypothetical protein